MTNKEMIGIFSKVKELPCGWCYEGGDEFKQALDLAIKALKEKPTGEWIKETDERLKGKYRCSECGRRVDDLLDDIRIHVGGEDYTIADLYPYCHCGAKMKGGEEE